MPTMLFAIVAVRALQASLDNGSGAPNLVLAYAGYLVLILGATSWRILRRHVLPAMYGDLLVTMAAETAWVLMLCAQMAVFDVSGLALGLAVATFQILAEGLRRLWVERI